MEKKDRTNYFIMNLIALFLIVIIVYLNYELMSYSFQQLKPASNGIYYGRLPLYPQFAYLISALLCSFLLQGEEILTIIRRRKSLLIRWEMILLGILALMLALIGIWLPLLFPENNYGVFIGSILLSRLWEVACMFAAGVFFVRTFHVHESIMNKRERIKWFIWSVLIILFIVLIVYLNRELKWYLIETSHITKSLGEIDSSYADFYILYTVNLISAFMCTSLLLGEKISTIIRRRKALLIRWELLILGVISILLAPMKIWFALIYLNIILPMDYDISFPTEINKIISLNDFWDNVLMLTAGMLIIHSFYIKNEQVDLTTNSNYIVNIINFNK